ncbi:serine/threonine-protein kinase [Leeia sp. TBRC 13508]|uniref:Serine/threonine-protein kinase n=1 Tax=Leeia speluncae TaxID=2884804 RepID=A0ABS8D6M9_9NEIS|nr:serine/threonine-protein kinase [Leeia speluncae]MCB6183856.1 serine/threonine-protein kinase [Leeia speluncae]
MRTRSSWIRDSLFALIVVVGFLALTKTTTFFDSFEGKVYDTGLKLAKRQPSNEIAVIAIDDKSLRSIGRWPWSREVMARFTAQLSSGEPKSIVNTVFFFDPQTDPGMVYINKLIPLVAKAQAAENGQRNTPPTTVSPAPADGNATESPDTPAPVTQAPEAPQVKNPYLQSMSQVLKDADKNLNVDKKLADAIEKSGTVVLSADFTLPQAGEAIGRPNNEPGYISNFQIPQIQDNGRSNLSLTAKDANWPLDVFGSHAAAIGYSMYIPDTDGVVRQESLYIKLGDSYYPSLSLIAAARQKNLSLADISLTTGGPLSLTNQKLPADSAGIIRPYFYANDKPFPVDSFFDVLSGAIPAEKYKDKLVLVGTIANGLGDQLVTPTNTSTPPVIALAHSTSSLLQGDAISQPAWADWSATSTITFIALYLMFILPRLPARAGAVVSLVLLAACIGCELYLLANQLKWVPLTIPALLLAIGHLAMTTRKFLFTEDGKARADAESAESNRMLGLAFQGQGQLDLAFDKFRKCPLDESMMDVLYNLALDFERKRLFNKSLAVYEYMKSFSTKFRDVPERLERAKQMQGTVILSNAAGSPQGTLITEGTEKPMLGRYQIERELGKGAMGVVYFGRDPKIGRTVAIKTMALSEEFAPEELAKARQRFFREAETAGQLNHPNIVTIYDAGEEHDLAYIAMEFLKGQNLEQYTQKDHLLPRALVLNIVAQIAEALDYAHKQQVVHRDIKPGNIMYEPASRQIKVTDFGIARITDSSRTRTGLVLGTPSYMSPEQLSGKRVDGRSDLFSLGVMLYQLLTGHLPFEGESMAELMFRIANETPTDITTYAADIPSCVVEIINKALQKDPDRRFINGSDFARSLKRCSLECEHG